jgi:hypothetical protein
MMDRFVNRYLVQFLDQRGYWVTDCAFQDGQLDKAQRYVDLITTSLDNVSAGLVLDQLQGPGRVVYSVGLRGDEDHPPLEDVRKACEAAASRIARLKWEQWAGWITYIMEALELETLDDRIGVVAYKTFLESVRDATDQRLTGGGW